MIKIEEILKKHLDYWIDVDCECDDECGITCGKHEKVRELEEMIELLEYAHKSEPIQEDTLYWPNPAGELRYGPTKLKKLEITAKLEAENERLKEKLAVIQTKNNQLLRKLQEIEALQEQEQEE